MAGIGHNAEGADFDALQRIANDLNSELADDVESIFRKGRKFLEYKKQLGHGNFLRLFANHRDPLPEPVRCSPQYARQFIEIAKNETLSNGNNSLYLPPTVDVLYALSKIDEPGLKVAFSEGWITPFTRKKDVKEIRIRLGIDDEPPPKSVDDEASDFIVKAKNKARKIIEALPTKHRGEFVFFIENMARDLRNELNATEESRQAAE